MTQIGDLSSTSSWVKFFTESGIPQSVAANYAVTFVENRITKQMLLDLNKEILHDMGVTVMGDIIAILKHAKIVHAQLTRDKVFKGELSVAPVPPARRAVAAMTRLISDDDIQVKVAKEQPSQVLEPAKRLSVKRKIENEVTPTKKLRIVRGGTLPGLTTDNKTSKVQVKSDAVNKITATNMRIKPPVFQRLSGGNSTTAEDLQSSRQNVGIIKRSTVKEEPTQVSLSKAPSVFDRLGPQKERASFEQITIKRDSSPERVASVKTSSLNRKIILSPLTKKSDSSLLMKKTLLTNQLVAKRVIKNVTTVNRGSSQGIFASGSSLTKSNTLRERLGLNAKKQNVIPVTTVGKKIIKLRQDEEGLRTIKTVVSTKSYPSSSKRMISTVSGSVFSRLGH